MSAAEDLKARGIETLAVQKSQIEGLKTAQQEEQQLIQPIQQQLELKQKTLQAQIALASAEGKTDVADKLTSANVALQQTLAQWQTLDMGNAAQSIEASLVRVPQAIGDAVAQGIFDHKKGQSVGTDVTKSLEGVGKQLTGQLITMAIEKLIATIIPQTVTATSQTAAITANTAAVIANTTAQGASAGAGAAGGIASGVGGAASAAGSAATSALTGGIVAAIGGIIGGVISAIATLVGDAGIIKAVNNTTAAVLSLRGSFQVANQTTTNANGTTSQSQAQTTAQTQSLGASIGASLMTALTGAGAMDVNVVSISPVAIGAGFLHMFAGGTDSAPGGFAMVGERGPEIMHVPKGAQIIPNHKIGKYADGTPGYGRAISGGRSMQVTVHAHAHGVNDPGTFARQAVAAIPHELKRQSSTFSPYSS